MENLEIDERIVHPLLSLLGKWVSKHHRSRVPQAHGTLDGESEDSFQPSDDIVQWLGSLPSGPTPFPGDRVPEGDVEMMEVQEDWEESAGRPSPESEDVLDMGTDVPRARSVNLDTLIALLVKEEHQSGFRWG